MPVTQNTLIRQLPMSVMRQLSYLMDPHDEWKLLAENIYRQDGTPRFDQTTMNVLENRGKNGNKGCTMMLLESWGTSNTKVEALVKALIEIKYIRVADYLLVDIMNGEPARLPEEQGAARFADENPVRHAPCPPTEEPYKHVLKPQPSPRLPRPAISEQPIRRFLSGEPTVVPQNLPMKTAEQHECDIDPNDIASPDKVILTISTGVEGYLFSKEELQLVTDNFNTTPLTQGGRLLGSGGFGEVFKGCVTDQFEDCIHVAVKRMFLEQKGLERTDVLSAFMTELKVLSRFRHENLLPLVGYSDEHDYICIVYKYMANGSLQDRLACKECTDALDVATRVSIAVGTAKGLCHLHNYEEKAMIHKDVKSANILLDENMIPKLGDFGQCRQGPRGINTTALVTSRPFATPIYTAPEVLRNPTASDISGKLDTYAYGVVLLEIVTGFPPIDDTLDDNEVDTDIISRVDDCDEDIYDLVDKKAGDWPTELADKIFHISKDCRNKKKHKRPTMTTVMPEIESLILLCSADHLNIATASDSKT